MFLLQYAQRKHIITPTCSASCIFQLIKHSCTILYVGHPGKHSITFDNKSIHVHVQYVLCVCVCVCVCTSVHILDVGNKGWYSGQRVSEQSSNAGTCGGRD